MHGHACECGGGDGVVFGSGDLYGDVDGVGWGESVGVGFDDGDDHGSADGFDAAGVCVGVGVVGWYFGEGW